MIYWPYVLFSFKFVIGTVYWQAEEKDGNLLMSAYGVYCCASPLFLSSVLMAHFNKALDVSKTGKRNYAEALVGLCPGDKSLYL